MCFNAKRRLSRVYGGTLSVYRVTSSKSPWVTLTLDIPFEYNNVDNLVIAVDENSPRTHGYAALWVTCLKSNARSLAHSMKTNIDPGM